MTTPDHLPDPDRHSSPHHTRVSPPKRSVEWLETALAECQREKAALAARLERHPENDDLKAKAT